MTGPTDQRTTPIYSDSLLEGLASCPKDTYETSGDGISRAPMLGILLAAMVVLIGVAATIAWIGGWL